MRASGLALCCTLPLGCAPSHRIVHEGDTYFEHCYAADFDERVREAQREACWQAWVAHYTRHQPAHRVDYAMLRIESLQNGEPAPTLAGHGAVATGAEGARAPGGDFASSLGPGAPVMESDAGPAARGCVPVCSAYEQHCRHGCPDTSVNCLHGCEHERAICLQGCY